MSSHSDNYASRAKLVICIMVRFEALYISKLCANLSILLMAIPMSSQQLVWSQKRYVYICLCMYMYTPNSKHTPSAGRVYVPSGQGYVYWFGEGLRCFCQGDSGLGWKGVHLLIEGGGATQFWKMSDKLFAACTNSQKLSVFSFFLFRFFQEEMLVWGIACSLGIPKFLFFWRKPKLSKKTKSSNSESNSNYYVPIQQHGIFSFSNTQMIACRSTPACSSISGWLTLTKYKIFSTQAFLLRNNSWQLLLSRAGCFRAALLRRSCQRFVDLYVCICKSYVW